jgi:NAD-dependent dihydropyrimidine dehydrogenase PreA subunit
MMLFKEKKDCCGCTACMSACPKNAIAMQPDEEGFLYPKIDESRCVQCHICERVCPLNHKVDSDQNFEQQIYAAKHLDSQIVESSSSGGAFTAISDYVLSQGGIVYGACFDSEFKVCHKRTTTKRERDLLKGSKYVQSDLGQTFSQVKQDLEQGETVLFTGTPCQNAGLLRFLRQKNVNIKNLFCCDFICHGVPSPLLWKEYVNFLQDRFQDKLMNFSFRDKTHGWAPLRTRAIFQKFCDTKHCNNNYSFLNLYSSLYIVRPSCFACPYTRYKRVSDITVADFWNIEKSNPDMDDNRGTSLVLVNSQKGAFLFSNAQKDLKTAQTTPRDC